METKICSKCGVEKPVTEYRKHKGCKLGVRPECKACMAILNHDYYQNNREKINKRSTVYRQKNKIKIAKNKYIYYRKNKHAAYERAKKSVQSRKDEVAKYQYEYAQTHKDNLREYYNNYHKNKALNNIGFRILRNLRARMRSSIIRGYKSKTTLELLGISGYECMDYLETLFRGDMTRENYGEVWHIDHIIPCSFFDLTNEIEQRICFNWRNLQPLFINENLAKKDNLPDNYLELYNEIKRSLEL